MAEKPGLGRPSIGLSGFGVCCAAAAVALGVLYMFFEGAPRSYLLVNIGALGGGILLVLAARVVHLPTLAAGNAVPLFLGVCLLAASLLGEQIEGATRWLRIGGVSVQPSLILAPLALVLFARKPDALSCCGIGLMAIALAIQPDRGMAGAVLVGLVGMSIVSPHRYALPVTGVAILGFVVTLLRPDVLPAMPYVEGVLFSSVRSQAVSGLAVWGGIAVMLLPVWVGWRGTRRHVGSVVAFGGVWIGVILAAAIGNYPTPLVGYGASAIVGYLFSVAALSAAPGEAEGRRD